MPTSDQPVKQRFAAPVHVVVLAAGRGSRLGAHADEIPKWLLEVGGRTLADRHLEGIALAGEAVASVRAVVGHAGDVVEAALDVAVVRNPEWAELNNWWSLLRALRVLPAEGPVAVINSDLLAEPETVAAFLTACAEAEEDALICVDLERELTDESMKVQLRDGDVLDRIGKVGIDDPAGEYPGLLYARGAALQALRDDLERFVDDPSAANEWYEGAVGRSAAAGTAWRVWPMPTSSWVEIDDHGDLDLAQALAGAR